MSASECHTPKCFYGHRSTDAVKGYVDAPPIGGVEDLRDEVVFAVVDCDVGAEFGGELQFLRGSGSRYHSGTAAQASWTAADPAPPAAACTSTVSSEES